MKLWIKITLGIIALLIGMVIIVNLNISEKIRKSLDDEKTIKNYKSLYCNILSNQCILKDIEIKDPIGDVFISEAKITGLIDFAIIADSGLKLKTLYNLKLEIINAKRVSGESLVSHLIKNKETKLTFKKEPISYSIDVIFKKEKEDLTDIKIKTSLINRRLSANLDLNIEGNINNLNDLTNNEDSIKFKLLNINLTTKDNLVRDIVYEFYILNINEKTNIKEYNNWFFQQNLNKNELLTKKEVFKNFEKELNKYIKYEGKSEMDLKINSKDINLSLNDIDNIDVNSIKDLFNIELK